MPGTHATMVSRTQERALLGSLATARSPAHDRVMARILCAKLVTFAQPALSVTTPMVRGLRVTQTTERSGVQSGGVEHERPTTGPQPRIRWTGPSGARLAGRRVQSRAHESDPLRESPAP